MAILMFHEREAVIPAAKLNINWTSVGVIAEFGTSRYTEMKTKILNAILKIQSIIWFGSGLLCCPVLSPQMMGVEEADPPTTKVSEQVPRVG
jgi:hypothetical protein